MSVYRDTTSDRVFSDIALRNVSYHRTETDQLCNKVVMWFLSIFLLISSVILLLRWMKYRLRISAFSKCNVLITGCDSGFGRELAIHLDKIGVNIFAGCFTEKGMDELRKVSSDHLTTFNLDVTKQKTIDSALVLVESKIDKSKGLWGLVNNAGIMCTFGLTEWYDVSYFNEMIDVNLYGPIRVTRTFLPLVRRARGRIVNVTSAAGRLSLPFLAPYSVTKYGMESYSDTLRREMHYTGVKVSIIEPGIFKTPIVDHTVFSSRFENQYANVSQEVRAYYGSSIYERLKGYYNATTAEKFPTSLYKVVNAMTHALSARYPKSRYVVGWDAKLVFIPMSVVPEWLSDYILAKFIPIPEFGSR